MHVRVRLPDKPEAIIVVDSKLTKIEKFRRILKEKFDIPPQQQRLCYGGKLLEDGYTFHDYNIKLNDVIQVMVQIPPTPNPEITTCSPPGETTDCDNISSRKTEDEAKEKHYEDAESIYYKVGDLIDMKKSYGAWAEGKIVRIVLDPDSPTNESITNEINNQSDEENKPPEGDVVKPKGPLGKYFTKVKKPLAKKPASNMSENGESELNLLYKVQLEGSDDDHYCKLEIIRPRARITIDVLDVKPEQTVMVNYNLECPYQIGHWYDLKVNSTEKHRRAYKLVGTLYLGSEPVTQMNAAVPITNKIYLIEDVVPLSQRTEQYSTLMTTPTEKRPLPLKCIKCRDDDDLPCRYCGCYICASKESPDKILLCDECDYGFHLACLDPPLTCIPDGDWYCPSCKRDPNEVVAPGAAVQAKKDTGNSTRDWGRGMACVGKTKTCSMPANHFGPIPGIEVGTCWRFRIQLSESGVHRPPVSGIHGRDRDGAFSIVLSGGYEDDVDDGYEFTYTGSGGRDLSGNKRTAEQSCDQKLTRENRALARNCAVNKISEDGGDAGDDWQKGKPVRVVRSQKMMKHFPKYAPEEGIRYDGIYKVVKYYPEQGLSGFRVWKYLLRRDDPSPAPWEEGAKEFTIIYPDGFLEAEAEKKALLEKGKGAKKRSLRVASTNSTEEKVSPVNKKKKQCTPKKRGRKSKESLEREYNITAAPKKSPRPAKEIKEECVLTEEEKDIIAKDTLNAKLWEECLEVCEKNDRRVFVEFVTQTFLCIICQDAAANPVTTPCLHNYCSSCLTVAFKRTKTKSCPSCRHDLTNFEPETNQALKTALRTILTGYDAGKY